MATAIDRVLDGRYRLVRELAEGGMGVIYEAEHLALRKRVAIKLLRSEVAEIPGVVARFEREARATSLLDDPHIVRVIDFGRSDAGELYLVMELLTGAPLSTLLEMSGPLDVRRALELTDQILAGLEVAHAHQLIHRDLKPDNIYITPDATGGEQVRIVDFGIASAGAEQRDIKLTQTGMVMGTPGYMSPEQAKGRSDVDARSDLHAVGVILYELLAGEPAYDGESYNEIIHSILDAKPPSLASVRPGLPGTVYALVTRAMASGVEARHQSATAFRKAIAACLTTVPTIDPVGSTSFRMPAQLITTDVRGEGAASRVHAEYSVATPGPPEQAQSALLALELDHAPALELDRPTPVPLAEPPRQRRSFVPAMLVVLVLGGGGFFAWRLINAPHDAIVEITNVPPGARMLLDGTPIVGRRLMLPISHETHILRVEAGHQPRTIHFSAAQDRVIDVMADANGP